jgi:hypothetical protein
MLTSRRLKERKHQRISSDYGVDCRSAGTAFKAVLSDVSIGGCMIEMSSHRLSMTDRVCLKVDNGIRMSGMVVWHDGRYAGVRFDDFLHEAVVNFLGYSTKDLSPSRIGPLDRFGRPLPRLRESYRPAAFVG